jgi:hypothetical protein
MQGRQEAVSLEAAQARYDAGDRTNDAINEMFEASRRRTRPA